MAYDISSFARLASTPPLLYERLTYLREPRRSMRHLRAERFPEMDDAELAAYADACAADIGLAFPDSFRSSVLENLSALQAHARRVSAALQAPDAGIAPAEVLRT